MTSTKPTERKLRQESKVNKAGWGRAQALDESGLILPNKGNREAPSTEESVRAQLKLWLYTQM